MGATSAVDAVLTITFLFVVAFSPPEINQVNAIPNSTGVSFQVLFALCALRSFGMRPEKQLCFLNMEQINVYAPFAFNSPEHTADATFVRAFVSIP